MEPTFREIEEAYHHALLKKSGAERAAYLDAACGADTPLRTEVEALLDADRKAEGFLEIAALDSGTTIAETPLSEGPGTVIGRYKLLERIGEGGMAVVYMAEQAEPIRRKVALKIIKLGMDTKQVIARFEAERQALAMMDHPNIAKVHDAGATETGRPYFVMELVTGVSITEYCDQNNLSTKDRLALFIQVCSAVQHAHQKGIIHRDIKPSNVMVAQRDGAPVPKVIDFGIAKATNQRLTEKTLFTRYAHIIGTPAYMSPEQAELSDLDVDTRSDIYSLGVLLYELLTGTTPFSEEELRKAGYLEMQRVIREQEPAKPSTKLSTLGDTLTDVAERRSTHPDVLRRAVRGDLDWIVMKALEKDRIRRYETANALGIDVQRHLNNEPVLARGPGAAYRLQKFLHRHRVRVSVVVAFAAVAVAASVMLAMWNRDRLELVKAESFRDRGILSQARELYAKADRETALETIKPILNSRHVGPEARLLRAGILVDSRRSEEAVAVLEDLLDGEPEIAGTAHSLLARILWESESPTAETLQEIEEQRQKAEALLLDTAEAHFLRAMTALTIKEQLISLDRALQLDRGHYESRRLRAFTYYASRKYAPLRDDALVMTILRPKDPLGYSLRAVACRELGRYPEAIADYDSAIALTAKGSGEYVDLSAERCGVFLRMGDYERVIADARACLRLSPDSPIFQYHIFCALTALGDFDKADALFQEIVGAAPTARSEFWFWATKHVFDTLAAGRSWHPPDREPTGAAFLPMVEAEETYRQLAAKGRRVVTDGFSAHWSPDGRKLAFSLGVHGYSGVALYDPATKEIELLIVPGKDPRWSPDGKYIAFVRDCQALRLEELATAERKVQDRWLTDEEVWVMQSDGTEPRRLVRGGWPSWSQDSTRIYYQSRPDHTLCSISIGQRDAEPERIMACANPFPSVSEDDQRVAYLEDASLKIKDLASQATVAEWPVSYPTWNGAIWSPTGGELSLAGRTTGLWIYDLDSSEPATSLGGYITSACWAVDRTNLVFCLGPPYFEIWAADLDPNVPTIDALGPCQTLEEHFRQMLHVYTRRIEADPLDAYTYVSRARYYDYLHDHEKANADMRRWSAVLSQDFSGFRLDGPWTLMRTVNGPLGCQLVVFVERQEDGMHVLRIAFGQKGRCQMKPLEIPMIATSLLSLCFLSGLDTPTARGDFTFGMPVNLGPAVNSSGWDGGPCISPDGLELYFGSGDPGDIWVARRATPDSEWGPAVIAGLITNSLGGDGCPTMSADGLCLYFDSGPPGDLRTDDWDLWMTTRMRTDAEWSAPVYLGTTVNSTFHDWASSISSNGLELYFTSNRPGGYGDEDIYVTRRAAEDAPWGTPVNLGPTLNSPSWDAFPYISPDGLALFFESKRPGGFGGVDLWISRRRTITDPWGPPLNLGDMVNSSYADACPAFSPDGAMFYFASWRPGGHGSCDIWQAQVIRIVDFNGDGKVDGKEVLNIAEHWGQALPAIDIGPTPLGDGVVDIQDLTALADYIGAEIDDPTLVAHWPLDETEGMLAFDSAGESDGVVVGAPVWQPDAGKVGGAIQCDGVDDMIITKAVPSLQDGPFSIVLWIRGGTPGQVILAQQGSGNWLCLNEADGSLMTGLIGSGRNPVPLYSDVVITDDRWHRIGLVWDGTKRILCVDGEEAASDEQERPIVSGNGLNIGCDGNVAPGSYFSGLIDDVRIYNRAVKP